MGTRLAKLWKIQTWVSAFGGHKQELGDPVYRENKRYFTYAKKIREDNAEGKEASSLHLVHMESTLSLG